MSRFFYPYFLRKLIEDIWLLYINISNSFYNFILFIREVISFYNHKVFRSLDLELFKKYLIIDQYQVSLNSIKQNNYDNNNFTYGETSLIAINKIMSEIDISKGDKVYDLGCGTGRICLFLNSYLELKVHGIDLIKKFIDNANSIVNKYQLKNIFFDCKDWLKIDFSDAKAIFIAGTCLEDYIISDFIHKTLYLNKNTYIISVSKELISEHLKLNKKLKLPFSWGKATVYIYKT